MSAHTLTVDQLGGIPDDFLKALHLTRRDKVTVRLQGRSIVVEPDSPLQPTLIYDGEGLAQLVADPRSPEMTVELVRDILSECP